MANPQDLYEPNGGSGSDDYLGSPRDFEDMWSGPPDDFNETTGFNPFSSDTQLGSSI